MATPPKTHLHRNGFTRAACGADPEWFRVTTDTRQVTCKRCRKQIPEYFIRESNRITEEYEFIDARFLQLLDERQAFEEAGGE